MIAWPLVRPYYPAFNSDELVFLPCCPLPIIGGFSPGEGAVHSLPVGCTSSMSHTGKTVQFQETDHS